MITLGIKDIIDILIIALLLFYVYRMMKARHASVFSMACLCFCSLGDRFGDI